MVRAFQGATDAPGTGWPWCAAFVMWCYANAGAVQPYRSAYVPALRNWYQAHGRKVTAAQVRPGDFVIYEWEHDQTPDHIGLFRRWMNHEHTEFEACEGNTSVGNNSNGGQVMVRLRPVSLVAMFARPVASRVPVGTRFDPVTGAVKRSVFDRLRRRPT
jgi:cell wall-associated NlpC family hydrolase